MINSKSKTKIKCISYSEIGDPLLLFGEEMEILSSNSDGDREGVDLSAMNPKLRVPKRFVLIK